MSEVLLLGNCLEVLKDIPDNSVDSVVTDPPYGLSFMNKKWDYDVPSVDIWREVFRVMKPGAHLLSFGGTRTYHRMVVAIEDAGFEIRDQIQWLYGSGFPKSHDISKGIDRAAGAEREVVDKAVKQWQGWGSALKPANEPIVLARKPLSESTLAKNVLRWGVGGLNIDASRIGTAADKGVPGFMKSGNLNNENSHGFMSGIKRNMQANNNIASQGRFPANLMLDEEAAALLDEQSGKCRSSMTPSKTDRKWTKDDGTILGFGQASTSYSDSGGASRFFYCAKASKRERGEGNVHPTVKPTKLMEYLIKLITPPGGVVLDPFTGSGSTGVAAKKLNHDFIGIEMSEEYLLIAKNRIAN